MKNIRFFKDFAKKLLIFLFFGVFSNAHAMNGGPSCEGGDFSRLILLINENKDDLVTKVAVDGKINPDQDFI